MESDLPLQHVTSEKRKDLTYRVRGIPYGVDEIALRNGLKAILESQDVNVDSLAQSSIRREGQVATIRVANSAKLSDPRDEWRIPAGRALAVDADGKSEPVLAIDAQFFGFTPLYSPTSDVGHNLDCIAISGLGSHAFGCWKDRDSHFMWLRDALPRDLPGARVLTYGYDTRLSGSHSFQNLDDVALKSHRSLKIALGDRPSDRPLIFIAHSLGGLVLKKALIQMASGSVEDVSIFHSTYGILFFGVPNQGMDIGSLLAMVGSQPNLPFITMLSKDAGVLQELIERFRTIFKFEDSEIISLYETHASRTARKDATGKWSMSGDYAVLVDRFSARSGRPWEEKDSFLQPIGRNHSDMVKYSEYDDDIGIVCDFLIRLAKPAPVVIRDSINRLESLITSAPSSARPLASRSQPQEKQAPHDHDVEVSGRRPTVYRTRVTSTADPVDHCEERAERRPYEMLDDRERWAKDLEAVRIGKMAEQRRHEMLDREIWEKEEAVAMRERARSRDAARDRSCASSASKGQDAPEQLDIPTEAKHRTEKLAKSTGNQSNEKARSKDGHQEGDSKTIMKKAKMPGPSRPRISENEDYEKMLTSEGFDIDTEDSRKDGLLWAARIGHVPLTQYLLARGTPIEVKNLQGWTPLHWAAFTANLELFHLLLFRGAMDSASTNSGKTPLHMANLYGKGYSEISHIEHYIGSSSDREAIALELLDRGLFVDVQNKSGQTPLLLASAYGLGNMIELLASKGADVQATDERRLSALHYASRFNHLGAVKVLLNEGTNPLSLDKEGRSPLDEAMICGHEEVAKRLKKGHGNRGKGQR